MRQWRRLCQLWSTEKHTRMQGFVRWSWIENVSSIILIRENIESIKICVFDCAACITNVCIRTHAQRPMRKTDMGVFQTPKMTSWMVCHDLNTDFWWTRLLIFATPSFAEESPHMCNDNSFYQPAMQMKLRQIPCLPLSVKCEVHADYIIPHLMRWKIKVIFDY